MKFLLSSRPLLVRVSLYLLALLFLFSGLAKAVNPFGLSIQFGEYFSAMGLDFLAPFSSLFSVLLPAFETGLGLMLLLGVFRRLTSILVLGVMGFFTLLTLWIALYNPVSDCGCFGDLFKISNWATFLKNIFFMIPSLILLAWTPRSGGSRVAFKMTLVVILSLVFPLYSLMHLPLIDATAFKVGVSIPQAMAIPEGAAQSEVETVLIYKNLGDGQLQEFSVNDTTWYDSDTWEYVDSRSRVISQGYVPPIAAFPLLDRGGQDRGSDILSSSQVLLVVTNDLSQVDLSWVYSLMGQGVRVVLVSSQSLDGLESDIEAYNSDFTLIRTMIQYPLGGAMLLRDGVIVSKWAMDQLPDSLE